MGHHYVPRFYLRKFAFNEAKTMVYSMTKDGKIHDKPNAISHISQKENYNTPQQESIQGKFEAFYSGKLNEFIRSPNPGNSPISNIFLEFVCFMLGNNILIRRNLMEGLSKRINVEIKSNDNNRTVTIDKGYRGQLNLSYAFSKKVYEELKTWKFERIGDDEFGKFFITSDNPVRIFNPKNITIPSKIHIDFNVDDEIEPIPVRGMPDKMQFPISLDSVSFEQDVILVFPITPNFSMLGFSDETRHASYRDFMNGPNKNNRPLALMNVITYVMCNRVVYSHSKDLLRNVDADKHIFQDHCQRNSLIPSFEMILE